LIAKRARAASLAVLAAAALVVCGCGQILGLSDLQKDAGSDLGAQNDGAFDTRGGCTATNVVEIPASPPFCIDATEVTQGDYDQFVTAVAAGASFEKPAVCAWNTTIAPFVDLSSACKPGAYDPATKANYPVTCIDWCDAYAYCRWVGKRLCAKIGGGSVPPSTVAEASFSEWMFACSKDGTQYYPYDIGFHSGTCNDLSSGLGVHAPVGSFAGCVGGYAGIFDMSGNAHEWEDNCDVTVSTDPKDHTCSVRGGSYADGRDYCKCDAVQLTLTRNQTDERTGFRCCADE
jgi:formylglycine-generating enzyme required for sulfatase activity